MALQINQQMQDCIENCNRCQNICQETFKYCLGRTEEYVKSERIQILQDCITICRTNVDFLSRNSERYPEISQFCADLCEQCAQKCEFFQNDPQMQKCANACYRCASCCEEMAYAAANS